MAIVLVVSLGVTSVIPEVKPPNLSLHQSRLPGSRDDGSRRVQNDGTRRVPLIAGYDRRCPSVISRTGARVSSTRS